jgi:hypothetical protein
MSKPLSGAKHLQRPIRIIANALAAAKPFNLAERFTFMTRFFVGSTI